MTQAFLTPEPLAEDDAEDLPKADLPVIADLAQRRMAQAVRRGRVVEALRWQKLHQILSAQIAAQVEIDRKAEAARTRGRDAQAHEARVRTSLAPNATAAERVDAELQAIIGGAEGFGPSDAVAKVENLEKVELAPLEHSDPANLRDGSSTLLSQALAQATVASSSLNRAQRRRVEKRMRKQE